MGRVLRGPCEDPAFQLWTPPEQQGLEGGGGTFQLLVPALQPPGPLPPGFLHSAASVVPKAPDLCVCGTHDQGSELAAPRPGGSMSSLGLADQDVEFDPELQPPAAVWEK